MDQLSDMQKAIFKRGTDVGKLAQQLFPDGVDASPRTQFEYVKAVKLTKELLEIKQKVIYEASFSFSDVLSVADIVANEKYLLFNCFLFNFSYCSTAMETFNFYNF